MKPSLISQTNQQAAPAPDTVRDLPVIAGQGGQPDTVPEIKVPHGGAHPVSAGQVISTGQCARCQRPLMDVAGWKWCPRCGYREEASAEPVEVKPARQKSAATQSELMLAVRIIPAWGWTLLGGVTGIAVISCAAHLALPPVSLARAVWTTAQIILGVVGVILASVSVTTLLGLQREQLGLTDLLWPDRIWRLAVRRLPDTSWHVCACAWAVSLIVCALGFIGGLTYYLPAKKPPVKPKVSIGRWVKEAAAADQAPGATSVDQAARDFAGTQELGDRDAGKKDEPAATATPAPQRSVTRCVIVGYTVKEGELAELVLATARGDELHYAGVVPLGTNPSVKADLVRRFAALKVSDPVFPDLRVQAVWLRPRLSCEVESAGHDEDQLLKEPRFKALVLPKTPQPVRLQPGEAPAGDTTPKDGKPAPAATKKPGREQP